MSLYIARRLLLIVPTLFGIMVINFVIVQAAPGGPVEQLIAQIQGTAVESTARVGGSVGGEASAPVTRGSASTSRRSCSKRPASRGQPATGRARTSAWCSQVQARSRW